MTIKAVAGQSKGADNLRSKVEGTECVFFSKCKTKYICTSDGSACFTRGTHTKIIKSLGLNPDKMRNVTVDFYYTGKGLSVMTFLNGKN